MSMAAGKNTLTLKKRDDDQPDGAEHLRTVMRQCADELDQALVMRIGLMDSESRVIAITAQRNAIMQAVAARLRESLLA